MRAHWLRFWSTLRHHHREKELQAEIEFHLQTLAEEYVKRGWSKREAQLAAKRDFGGAEQMKEIYRERRGFPFLESLGQDVKLGLRGLRKTPAFTATAILSLALGIGANTAIFSFFNAVLLKSLPVPEPEQLVSFSLFESGKNVADVFSLQTIQKLAAKNDALVALAGKFSKAANLSVDGTPQRIMAELVTGQYFEALRITPALGRLLTEEDVRNADGNPVCVLSYDIWQTNFGGDPKVLGRAVLLNGHPYRVVGVTKKGFHGVELQQRMDLQAPATRITDFMPGFKVTNFDWRSGLRWLRPIGRCKPNLTDAQVESQLQVVYRQIDSGFSRQTLQLVKSHDGFNSMRTSFGKPIAVLMAVVALVLLITCANLANLLLARAQTREKEFAVRLSLGSSRARLIRQLLIESLLLALLGGSAGGLLALWISNTLLAFLNVGRTATDALYVPIDATVLWFSLAVSCLTAILFGLVPAWQTTNPDLLPSLKEEINGSQRPVQRVTLRRLLVVTQVALSLTVLFASGLLVQTLKNLRTVDIGFQPEKVVAFSIDTDAEGYSNEQITQIQDEILQRLRLLPGVQAASLAVFPPFGGDAITVKIEVPGFTSKTQDKLQALFRVVSPDYFRTLRQPHLTGRDFSNRDTQKSRKVAIVNQQLAQHYFPNRSPLGQHIKQDATEVEIVGVVANAHDVDLRKPPQDIVYLPEKQTYSSGATFLLSTRWESSRMAPSLYALVHNIDKRVAITSLHTLHSQIDAGLSSERILSYLSGLLAGLATLLTAIGLYGVIAYGVTRRAREIGIRFAIGAQRRNIAWLFLHESFTMIILGVIVGAPLALIFVRILKSVLFGLSPTDVPTLSFSVSVLLLAGLLATVFPLKRALYADPIRALRYE